MTFDLAVLFVAWVLGCLSACIYGFALGEDARRRDQMASARAAIRQMERERIEKFKHIKREARRAERMRTATEEKAARKAEAAAETARRMEASQAVKDRLISQAKGLVSQEREQFMARARAKRERKRKAKV